MSERSRYAPLHAGRNTVKITYNRLDPKESYGVEITYEVLGYPAPMFYARVPDADHGTFEGSFDISPQPPAGFKPLVFTESHPATSGPHPGANTLKIEYSTRRQPLPLYILGPHGASTRVLRSDRETQATFIVQGPAPAPTHR